MDTKVAQELAEVVTSHGHSFTKNQGITIGDLPGEFCALWPKARPVLATIASIIVFIPGVGAATGAVLSGLLKVGDQISDGICK